MKTKTLKNTAVFALAPAAIIISLATFTVGNNSSAKTPPLTHETATAKVQAAEDAWNIHDPKKSPSFTPLIPAGEIAPNF